MKKHDRSISSKKGWETRRAKQFAAKQAKAKAKQFAAKQAKAKAKAKSRRSEAAKRGWETRRLTRKEKAKRHLLKRPTIDYLEEISKYFDLELDVDFDLDLSDLYDLYYGYEPGGES